MKWRPKAISWHRHLRRLRRRIGLKAAAAMTVVPGKSCSTPAPHRPLRFVIVSINTQRSPPFTSRLDEIIKARPKPSSRCATIAEQSCVGLLSPMRLNVRLGSAAPDPIFPQDPRHVSTVSMEKARPSLDRTAVFVRCACCLVLIN